MATIESLLYQAEEAQHRQDMDSILTDLIVKLDLEERYYRYLQKIEQILCQKCQLDSSGISLNFNRH